MVQTPAADRNHPQMPARGYGAILIGIIAASLAAIFIRFAQNDGLPSLVIAGGRLTIASLVLTPFALRRNYAEIRTLNRNDLILAGLSGVFLALHFATWIASLEFTTVLISVVLVSTSPLWTAFLEVVFLRARLRRLVIFGLLVAVGGGLVIALGGESDMTVASNPVLGGGLALTGAIAIAIYFVIGRRVRAKLTILPYIWLVYSGAAIALIVAILVTGTQITVDAPEAYLWVVLLALVPQLIGHTSFNFALRYLSATYVSIITQMEPIASAIAAFIIFEELPVRHQIVGSIGIIIGVILATLGQAEGESTSEDT
jgi:drug/metabolite transporter (DMT)-like permease